MAAALPLVAPLRLPIPPTLPDLAALQMFFTSERASGWFWPWIHPLDVQHSWAPKPWLWLLKGSPATTIVHATTTRLPDA